MNLLKAKVIKIFSEPICHNEGKTYCYWTIPVECDCHGSKIKTNYLATNEKDVNDLVVGKTIYI